MMTPTSQNQLQPKEITKAFASHLGALRDFVSTGANTFLLSFAQKNVEFWRQPHAKTADLSFFLKGGSEKIEAKNLILVKNSALGFLYIDQGNQRIFSIEPEDKTRRNAKRVTLIECAISTKQNKAAVAEGKLPAIDRVAEVAAATAPTATPKIIAPAITPPVYKFSAARPIATIPQYKPLRSSKPDLVTEQGRDANKKSALKYIAAVAITGVLASGAQMFKSFFSRASSFQPETSLVKENKIQPKETPRVTIARAAQKPIVQEDGAPRVTDIKAPTNTSPVKISAVPAVTEKTQPRALELRGLTLSPGALRKDVNTDATSLWPGLILPEIPRKDSSLKTSPAVAATRPYRDPIPVAVTPAEPAASDKIASRSVVQPAPEKRIIFTIDPERINAPVDQTIVATVEKLAPSGQQPILSKLPRDTIYNVTALNQPINAQQIRIVESVAGDTKTLNIAAKNLSFNPENARAPFNAALYHKVDEIAARADSAASPIQKIPAVIASQATANDLANGPELLYPVKHPETSN